jgi:thiol-disulfide isomerase/thioredoxin
LSSAPAIHRPRSQTLVALIALLFSACATVPDAALHPEAPSYAATADATAEVDAALARAATSGKRVLLVMGANWCHDSRALAGWLEAPRFAALVAARYELVFVDVGTPQTGEGRNIDIAQRFGLADVPGTPAVLVLTAEGQLLNADTATSWRNAASRSEGAIFAELDALAQAPAPNAG